MWLVEIHLVLYAGRKSLGFSVSIEIHLVFVWVVITDLILGWIELEFRCRDEIDVVVVLMVVIDLT